MLIELGFLIVYALGFNLLPHDGNLTDSTLRSYISTCQPVNNSGSPEGLVQLRQWFNDCQPHHKHCRDTTSHQPIAEDELHKLPTRVINVGFANSDGDPHLIETSGCPKGHWLALTYCWGKNENHSLKILDRLCLSIWRVLPCLPCPRHFRMQLQLLERLEFIFSGLIPFVLCKTTRMIGGESCIWWEWYMNVQSSHSLLRESLILHMVSSSRGHIPGSSFLQCNFPLSYKKQTLVH